jgi:3-deoxy-D-manno-octulosonate 8-phosphate phosphatase KdsC-like HAD superfamily phosphatase
MKTVSYTIAPADVHINIRIKKIAKIITETIGKDGTIREIVDFIV